MSEARNPADRNGLRKAAALAAFLCLSVGLNSQANAAPAKDVFGGRGIPAKGFKIAEPYGPPYETQIKSKLEGGQALVLPGGSALLSDGVTLHTYTETNTVQLTVRARECFYNATNHVVDSSGPIQMETADGRFSIEGTGFYWQQTNSSLTISNEVRTRIRQEADPSKTRPNGPGTTESGPLLITSRSFSYDGPSRRGIWRDNVQVAGTNLVVRSGVLTAEVPMNERQVRTLLAERQVTVDYGELHATGERLTYEPDTGLVRLSERATWKASQREGRGDELVIDRTNQIFQVNHHAWLKLPGQTLGELGFLAVSNSPVKKSSAAPKGSIEIACDNYEVRTNSATFQEQVVLEERTSSGVRGRLTCDQMIVSFAGTNELQTLTADKHVEIAEADNRFTSGHAVYTHTNRTLEMTQNPAWQSGARQGKGDLLRLNAEQNEMVVSGNAYLRLPATELAGRFFTKPGLGVPTNQAPRLGTNEFAEIFCEEYALSPEKTSFRGGVYATHPEMNWSCETLLIQSPAKGMTNLVAEQNVVFDLLTQKGEVHGKSDTAVFSFGVAESGTNRTMVDELKLTGSPAILSATNGTFQNKVIIWDRAKDKLGLPGSDYRIQGYAKPIDTNIFLLPNRKRTK